MPDRALLDITEATPEWLTRVLRAQGSLLAGCVESVRHAGDASVHAHTARLEIAYSLDTAGVVPSTLFLKICKEGSTLFGDSEVQYYTMIAAAMADPPIPLCYHAAYDPDTNRYHLLLQDLTQTHQVLWNVAPALPRALKSVEALAQLHVPWWDSPQLTDRVGRYPDAAVIERYVSHARPGVESLLTYLGQRLTGQERDIIRRVFDIHPGLLVQRAEEGSHFTCIHGDPNPGNILSPRDPDGRAYLIDRQPFPWSLTTWIGVSDLAYMMVHGWDTDLRRQLQEPLLRAYLQQLERSGIQDYPWEKLWADYRLAALQSFYVVWDWNIDPIEQTEMEWVWWPQLQKTLAAYRDLSCAELLAAV